MTTPQAPRPRSSRPSPPHRRPGPALPRRPPHEQCARPLAEIFGCDVDVLPVSTGSAANALSLAALTPPWGSVLCHRDSHINTDEGGAPEFFTSGAKLVSLPGDDAKIGVEQLHAAANRKVGDVHSVQPSVVSITQATETGALYNLAEIRSLGLVARTRACAPTWTGPASHAVAALGCTPAELTWQAASTSFPSARPRTVP
ncbi:beta-eliminating lyase-related protein [Streptomyces sp. NPDC086033]|uniref:beta-eliminating lyase-related protein n=1 Tax=Streptomyces sp. NPDC086033 TaxID=3365747 RepID=UPI0037D97EAD